MHLDHIGIAVDDLDKAKTKFEESFNCVFSQPCTVENQAVEVCFATLGPVRIELICATSSQSPMFPILPHPVLSFLKKNGWGVHHISFTVSNLQAALTHFKQLGVSPIYDQVEQGADGLVSFLDPNAFNGLLIELCEEHS
jgi:methylmalonyl-CoA/ethylmalonyl-CoA epimerase